MEILYTIGHSQKSLKEFISSLAASFWRAIIDRVSCVPSPHQIGVTIDSSPSGGSSSCLS